VNDVILQWPSHFPPKTRSHRFFIGVRGLGPDLSFFADLRRAQAQRTDAVLAAWPEELRDRALSLGKVVAKAAGWPTPFFLPQDSFNVSAYGPRLLEYQEHPIEEIAFAGAQQFGGAPIFWESALEKTFGEVVNDLAHAPN
jgi:hypothetical protein